MPTPKNKEIKSPLLGQEEFGHQHDDYHNSSSDLETGHQPPVESNPTPSNSPRKKWQGQRDLASLIIALIFIICRGVASYIVFRAVQLLADRGLKLDADSPRWETDLTFSTALLFLLGPIMIIFFSRFPSTRNQVLKLIQKFLGEGSYDAFLERCEVAYGLKLQKSLTRLEGPQLDNSHEDSNNTNDQMPGASQTPQEQSTFQSSDPSVDKISYQTESKLNKFTIPKEKNIKDSYALQYLSDDELGTLKNFINCRKQQLQNSGQEPSSNEAKLFSKITDTIDIAHTSFSFTEADDLKFLLQTHGEITQEQPLADRIFAQNTYKTPCLNRLREKYIGQESTLSIELMLDEPQHYDTAYGLTPYAEKIFLLVKKTSYRANNFEFKEFILIEKQRALELSKKPEGNTQNSHEQYSLVEADSEEQKRFIHEIGEGTDTKKHVGFLANKLNGISARSFSDTPGDLPPVNYIIDERPLREKTNITDVLDLEEGSETASDLAQDVEANIRPTLSVIFSHLLLQTFNVPEEAEVQTLDTKDGPYGYRNLLHPMKEVAATVQKNMEQVLELLKRRTDNKHSTEDLESHVEFIKQYLSIVEDGPTQTIESIAYFHGSQLLFPTGLEKHPLQITMEYTGIPVLAGITTIIYAVGMFDGVYRAFGPQLEDETHGLTSNEIVNHLLLWTPIALITSSTILVFIFFTITSMLLNLSHYLGYLLSDNKKQRNSAAPMFKAAIITLFGCLGLALQGLFTLEDVLSLTPTPSNSLEWIIILTMGVVFGYIYNVFTRDYSALQMLGIVSGPIIIPSKNLPKTYQEVLFKVFKFIAWLDILGTMATFIQGGFLVFDIVKNIEGFSPWLYYSVLTSTSFALVLSIITATYLHIVFSIEPAYINFKNIMLKDRETAQWLLGHVLNYDDEKVESMLKKIGLDHDYGNIDDNEEDDADANCFSNLLKCCKKAESPKNTVDATSITIQETRSPFQHLTEGNLSQIERAERIRHSSYESEKSNEERQGGDILTGLENKQTKPPLIDTKHHSSGSISSLDTNGDNTTVERRTASTKGSRDDQESPFKSVDGSSATSSQNSSPESQNSTGSQNQRIIPDHLSAVTTGNQAQTDLSSNQRQSNNSSPANN